jgi:peptide/nickel transport system substrate-binding protein
MRRMTTLGGVASIATAIVLAAAGCGSSDEGGGGGSVKADQNAGGTVGKGAPVRKGGEMTVGLAEDPDQLDPTLARTFVGRIVFANMCEKLYDLDQNLKIVPQLAAGLPKVSGDGKTVTIKLRSGIRFNDGTKFDAAAVKTSLDRHRTLKESSRASELAPVTSVTAVDPSTVKIELSKPFAPLTAQLADRAGMVMSPKQLKKLGAKFANDPVCVGPFKFSQRTESDKIVLVRAPDYYDASKVKLDKLTFKIITESSARVSNLRSGDIDVADRLAPTDLPTIKKDTKLQTLAVTSLGYNGLTLNIGNKNGLGKPPKNVGTPLAKDPKLREAFDAALDRKGIAKIVYDNGVVAGCSPISPVNPFHDDSQKCPARDLAKAKKLVKESGAKTPVPVTLMLDTDAVTGRLGQVIQAMTKEAGFAVKLQPTEFTSALDKADAGDFDAFLLNWSGRVDPDGDIYQFAASKGSLNDSGYSNPKLDAVLDKARETNDEGERKDLYKQAVAIIGQDRPLLYLYHEKYITGASKKVAGLKVFGDGLLRFKEAGFGAG